MAQCLAPEILARPLMPKRILIITNGHLCRNPRPLKEAETLGRAGYDVTVLGVRNHPPSEAFDRELLRNAPFRHIAIDMLPGYATGAATVFLQRVRLWTARRLSAHFRIKTIHALCPVAPLLQCARRNPADLTLVHTEGPLWIGMQLQKQGRRVAADFEDWHSEDLLPEEQADRPQRLIRRIEQTLLGASAFATTTSNALADALHTRYGGRRAEVITNSFPLQPDPHQPAPEEPPTLFWFSQTLGPGRGLESFLAAWQQTQIPSGVILLGEPCEAYDRTLAALLPDARRQHVKFRGLVPPEKLPSTIASHDIGLALEPDRPANKNCTISNKILQYLNAGLAVVASNTAGHREVLSHSSEAGVVVDLHDTAPFARSLNALLKDRAALLRRQQAARRLAEDLYCWDREAPKLLALVRQALA